MIVGAGVVGLSAAAQLAAAGHSVCVLESHPRPGTETSTHNSGVIHAGLYYPPGTLKAQLCVDGAGRLYSFCAAHRIPHDRCGKLVVATTEEEIPAIEDLQQRGRANGVADLRIVECSFIRAREPHVEGRAALWSPATGRIEPEALVRTLLHLAEKHDAVFLRGARFAGARWKGDGFEVHTPYEVIATRTVVNAAGLHADVVSEMLGGERFTIFPCRGEYAELKKSRTDLLHGLVYPLPESSGHSLGVHLTKTIAGRVLLGPTARFQQDKSDYESGRLPLDAFLEPTRRLMPEVRLEDLAYGGTGLRPKLHDASGSFADFMIRPDANRPALIHAAGIDSPGLTACLAIGARVARFVTDILE